MSDQMDFGGERILDQNGILPGELMEIILANLPVKSLLKFKAVCKPWYYFISSPSFIKMHLHRQSVISDNLLLSLNNMVDDEDCKSGLINLDLGDSYGNGMILDSPPSLSLEEEYFTILGSCNGIVGVYRVDSPRNPGLFILWNPATGEHWCSSPPVVDDFLAISSIGLCYVEATDNYKFAGWIDIELPRQTDMDTPYMFFYSLNSDWNFDLVYDVDKFTEVYEQPTFSNGCMNWLAKTCNCSSVCTCKFANMIMAFNVTTNVMSSFGIPNNCGCGSETSMKTLVIRGCLSIVVFSKTQVVESGMEVWRMVDFGVEGSWVKQFTIQGLTMVMVPLMSWQEDEIVFISRNEIENENILTFYDPFTKEQNYLGFKSLYVNQVFNYVESLVSVPRNKEIAIAAAKFVP